MNTPLKWTLAIVLAVGIGAGGYFLGHTMARRGQAATEAEPTTPAADEADAPLVAVQTVLIRQGTLVQKIIAYGPVTTQSSDVSVISVPFESRIGHLVVSAGQEVAAGAVIGDIAPSPETLLQIHQATATLAAAKKDLEQTQQRFGEHLATNTELLQSQQNLETAQLKLNAFNTSGAGESQKLKAQASGIISKIDVQDGQIVPAGGPLVEVAAGSHVVARLGVEPQDAAFIHQGDSVSLTEVRAGSNTVVGKVNLVTRRVNTDTRLVDVFVTIPKNSGFILEGFVRGELTASSARGFVLPRDAVLPGDDGYTLFTVKDGKAARHKVDVGLQNDQDMLVTGDGIHAGDQAIVVGNYELEDGMAVKINTTTTQSAATEPAAQPEGTP